MKTTITSLIVLFLSISLYAQGRIIIEDPRMLPGNAAVQLKKVDATIKITSGIARITLDETFYNPAAVVLEGEYIFPLPHDAQISDFHLYIDGKKTRGQLLDSDEALETYTNIVRSMRDPALLEYAGNSLFKARIFPINPKTDRRIEMSYTQILNYENGTYKLILPVKQCGQGTIENYHLQVDLNDAKKLGDIYSPSHKIQAVRSGNDRATVTLQAHNLESTSDFILYYSLNRQDIDGTLLSFRPRTDRDGYFMFFAAPGQQTARQKTIAKDYIFLMDVSGSMQGQKINQARDALTFCVNALNPSDRFEIITFSSGVENFQGKLSLADSDQVENARYFINNLSANGGTNIDAALRRAFSLKEENDQRPTSIIFVTDGLPTEGEQSIGQILKNAMTNAGDYYRLFSFGVGFDVNTFLLDKLSGQSHGTANYIKPGENIEQEISSLFSKISSPVLTSPEVNFGSLKVYDVYPANAPDLFQGQRLTIFGRYRQSGESNLELHGNQGNVSREYYYKGRLKRRESENEFIAKLWANRKVSHLLTKIRFNGENPELIESIKILGKEYGLVTPYTSYLVKEQEKELADVRQNVNSGRAGATAIRMRSSEQARELKAEMDEESIGSGSYYKAISAAPRAAKSSSGKDAVMASRILKKIAASDVNTKMLLTVQSAAGRTFYLKNGIWTQSGLESEVEEDLMVHFLDDKYFLLVRENPQIRKILAIGENMIFKWQGKIYRIKS